MTKKRNANRKHCFAIFYGSSGNFDVLVHYAIKTANDCTRNMIKFVLFNYNIILQRMQSRIHQKYYDTMLTT